MCVKYVVVLFMFILLLSWVGIMIFQFCNLNFGGNLNNGVFLLNSVQV